MDFDWLDPAFDLRTNTPKDIEESFEDPFSLRILPDTASGAEVRYFNLGRAVNGKHLFSVFWTDGKRYRVVFSRVMSSEEQGFYERINSENV